MDTCPNLQDYNSTQPVETSDIYVTAFLVVKGLNYKVRTEPSTHRRVLFIFGENPKKAKELIQNFYAGVGDEVKASEFTKMLRDLKSLVFNI